jgi:glutamine amidotransferase
MIGIIDYGVGNLASVKNAYCRLGHECRTLKNPSEIDLFDRIILPGVGSFKSAMNVLINDGWVEQIEMFVTSNRPLLGICLGMQLLFDSSEEKGLTLGLGLMPGKVIILAPRENLRIPHVGWNSLIAKTEHKLLNGVDPSVDVYFVHSYQCVPASDEDIIAKCEYGVPFVAAVARKNIFGVQFHPEKSQPSGLRILDNFAQWEIKC